MVGCLRTCIDFAVIFDNNAQMGLSERRTKAPQDRQCILTSVEGRRRGGTLVVVSLSEGPGGRQLMVGYSLSVLSIEVMAH